MTDRSTRTTRASKTVARRRRSDTTSHHHAAATGAATAAQRSPTQLERLLEHLRRPDGAALAELVAVTGWQPYSVRGALAGALRRKGHVVRSARVDGVRRYRLEDPAS